jgi:hypothetical protein
LGGTGVESAWGKRAACGAQLNVVAPQCQIYCVLAESALGVVREVVVAAHPTNVVVAKLAPGRLWMTGRVHTHDFWYRNRNRIPQIR